jgi:trimeric autotransporter adhesin
MNRIALQMRAATIRRTEAVRLSVVRLSYLVLVAVFAGCSGHGSSGASSKPTAQTKSVKSQRQANGMILDAATGQPRGFVNVDGAITAATGDGHGGWFIAGGFSRVDGVPRSNLAHINRDGALDTAWRPPTLSPALMSPFLSVAVQGHKVLVAGPFRNADGHPRHGAVALDRDNGSVDPSWRPPKVCADGDWRIEVAAGRIYLATACAAPPCLVRLDRADGAVSDWSAGIVAVGEIGCVNSVATSAGVVAFTGGFTQVGGQPRNGIAAVNADTGGVVDHFDPHGRCAQAGHAIAITDQLTFVGGDGCLIGAFALANGRQLCTVPRHGSTATTATLATYAHRVYLGGSFGSVEGSTSNGFAALNQRSGRPLHTWHPPAGSQLEAISISGHGLLIGAL